MVGRASGDYEPDGDGAFHNLVDNGFGFSSRREADSDDSISRPR